jgi:hypothetical protein
LLAFASLPLLAEGCSFSVLQHSAGHIIASSPPPLTSDTMSTSPAKTVVGFDVLANKILTAALALTCAAARNN